MSWTEPNETIYTGRKDPEGATMQCEFSQAELIDLDLLVIRVLSESKLILRAGKGNKEMLEASINELEALHKKLDAYLGQTHEQGATRA